MYARHFGLSENPFNLTPDQRYLYQSRQHEEALEHMLYAINNRKGFVVVTGDIGTGKTTICRALLNRLDANVITALVFNTFVSPTEFLRAVLKEFGVSPGEGQGADTHYTDAQAHYVDLLNKFLLKNHQAGCNATLIIDEAQNLPRATLEQVRMLSNLETDREKLIQIVLVGQTELLDTIQSPSLGALRDRITVWYKLEPLSRREMDLYIAHRMSVASDIRGIMRFNSAALETIYSFSKGNPRRVNAVCDRALLIAYCNGYSEINRHTANEAIADIRGRRNELVVASRSFRMPMPKLTIPFVAVAAALVLAGFFGLFGKKPVASSSSASHDNARALSLSAKEPSLGDSKQSTYSGSGATHAAEEFSLDDKSSLRELSRLFDVQEAKRRLSVGEVYPGLFLFRGDKKIYNAIKRPFRIRLKRTVEGQGRYLVIRKSAAGRPFAVSDGGEERPVTDQFIMSQWGDEVSWIYPYAEKSTNQSSGATGLEVLRIQEMLNALGYTTELRGLFDQTTTDQMMRFQSEWGLQSTGIADIRTKALLYQMTTQG